MGSHGAGSSLSGIAVIAEGDGPGWQSRPKAQRLSGINTASLRSHRGCRGLAVAFPPVQLEKNSSGRWEGLGEPIKTSAKWYLLKFWGGSQGGGGTGSGAMHTPGHHLRVRCILPRVNTWAAVVRGAGTVLLRWLAVGFFILFFFFFFF